MSTRVNARLLCVRLVSSKRAFTSDFTSLFLRALKRKGVLTTDFTSVCIHALESKRAFTCLLFALTDCVP